MLPFFIHDVIHSGALYAYNVCATIYNTHMHHHNEIKYYQSLEMDIFGYTSFSLPVGSSLGVSSSNEVSLVGVGGGGFIIEFHYLIHICFRESCRIASVVSVVVVIVVVAPTTTTVFFWQASKMSILMNVCPDICNIHEDNSIVIYHFVILFYSQWVYIRRKCCRYWKEFGALSCNIVMQNITSDRSFFYPSKTMKRHIY